MPEPKRATRNAEIVRLRRVEGLSFAEIGRRYNLSRQRVHRIVWLAARN